VVAAAIGMSRTLWIAAVVDLVAIAAMLAAPSVRHLQRLDEPQLEHARTSPPANLRAGALGWSLLCSLYSDVYDQNLR
jgi:hypothetical protein